MKITRVAVHRVSLADWNVTTRYTTGRSVDIEIETNLVRIDTDSGLTGWGESCTAPSYYYPTLSAGTRAAIEHVAPLLVGADPTNINALTSNIAIYMRGQSPAKAALEMALWDLFGQHFGLPLCELWGGRAASEMPVLAMVSAGEIRDMIADIERYRAQGYRRFQIKIGLGDAAGDIERITEISHAMQPSERCWFDANRAWTVDHAMQIIPHVAHLRPLIEQPCETYEECRTVATRTGLGLMLDESINGADSLIQAVCDRVIDVAVLKLTATGGLNEQRFLAELGVRLRVPMRIEDFYGTGITLAAMTHLAHTLPHWATFGLYDYHLPATPVVRNPLPVIDGTVRVPADAAPGLGVEIDTDLIGAPDLEFV